MCSVRHNHSRLLASTESVVEVQSNGGRNRAGMDKKMVHLDVENQKIEKQTRHRIWSPL